MVSSCKQRWIIQECWLEHHELYFPNYTCPGHRNSRSSSGWKVYDVYRCDGVVLILYVRWSATITNPRLPPVTNPPPLIPPTTRRQTGIRVAHLMKTLASPSGERGGRRFPYNVSLHHPLQLPALLTSIFYHAESKQTSKYYIAALLIAV